MPPTTEQVDLVEVELEEDILGQEFPQRTDLQIQEAVVAEVEHLAQLNTRQGTADLVLS